MAFVPNEMMAAVIFENTFQHKCTILFNKHQPRLTAQALVMLSS